MTAQDYETREIRRANEQMAAPSHAPLQDRQEARQAYADAMAMTPEIVAERIEWLLIGNYGFGSYIIANDVLSRKRMNRAAALGQMIAALEWGCPVVFARQAYVGLSRGEQSHLDELVAAAIADHEEG